MRTLNEWRLHLKDVERELILATREDRLTEAVVREYITASDNVRILELRAAEYAPRREEP